MHSEVTFSYLKHKIRCYFIWLKTKNSSLCGHLARVTMDADDDDDSKIPTHGALSASDIALGSHDLEFAVAENARDDFFDNPFDD